MSLKAWWAKVPSRHIEAIGILILLISAGLFAAVTALNEIGPLARLASLTWLVTELANALASDDPKGHLRAQGLPMPPFDLVEYIRATEAKTVFYRRLKWLSGSTFTLGTLLVAWAKWRKDG